MGHSVVTRVMNISYRTINVDSVFIHGFVMPIDVSVVFETMNHHNLAALNSCLIVHLLVKP